MTRWERVALFGSNLLVAGTGLIYAVMRYVMPPVDEWAVVNHPWQPQVQHLHVLAAPLLVFTCGLIWHRHVAGQLGRNGERGRRTGPGLMLALAPMVASGYLLQVSVDEGWRRVWVAVHLVASTIWMLAFVAHLASGWWRRRPETTKPRRMAGDLIDAGGSYGAKTTLVQPSRRSSNNA